MALDTEQLKQRKEKCGRWLDRIEELIRLVQSHGSKEEAVETFKQFKRDLEKESKAAAARSDGYSNALSESWAWISPVRTNTRPIKWIESLRYIAVNFRHASHPPALPSDKEVDNG